MDDWYESGLVHLLPSVVGVSGMVDEIQGLSGLMPSKLILSYCLVPHRTSVLPKISAPFLGPVQNDPWTCGYRTHDLRHITDGGGVLLSQELRADVGEPHHRLSVDKTSIMSLSHTRCPLETSGYTAPSLRLLPKGMYASVRSKGHERNYGSSGL